MLTHSARLQKRLTACIDQLKDDGIEAAMRGDYRRAADLTILAASVEAVRDLYARVFPLNGKSQH